MKEIKFPKSLQHWGQILLVMIVITSLLAGCQQPKQESSKMPTSPSDSENISNAEIKTAEPREDLPPALVEVAPLPNSQIGLQQPISLYFNQPMDKESVEAAIRFEPSTSGRFDWKDDQVLTFTPDQAVSAGSHLRLVVNTSAQAANRENLQEAIEIDFYTTEKLRVAQFFPSDEAMDVNPESSVFVSFNQPVVPLGELADAEPAFTLIPEVPGTGAWINTSTYLFKPDPSMAGGTRYELHLNESLTAVSGSILDSSQTRQISFSTTKPYVLSILPLPGDLLSLDGPITVKFNMRMDQASVEQHFNVISPKGRSVHGSFEWDEDSKQFEFRPDELLERNALYTVRVTSGAESRGGLAIDKMIETVLTTFPEFSIDPEIFPNFEPYSNQYGIFRLIFTTPVDAEDIKGKIVIEPSENIDTPYVFDEGMSVSISGFFAPETEYQVTIDGDLQDKWGGRLGDTLTYPFITPPAEPSVSITTGTTFYDLVFVPASESVVVMQATNVSTLSLELSPISLSDLITLVHPENYDYRQVFLPEVLEKTTISLNLPRNKSELVRIPLTYQESPLSPGIYFLGISSPDIDLVDTYYVQKWFLIVSQNNAVMKISPEQVTLWVTQLGDYSPVGGAPITVYSTEGEILTQGQTDADGLFTGSFERPENEYATYFSMIGKPGEDQFGFTISTWGQLNNLYEMGINLDLSPSQFETYIYTDRPLYRPGDRVNFRAAIFSRVNGMPIRSELDTVIVKAYSYPGATGISQELYSKELPLSSFGTVADSFELDPDAPTGMYHIELISGERTIKYFYFDVAAYRKPEIDIAMDLEGEEIQAEDEMIAHIQADYYFGMPAFNQDFQWSVSSDDAYFYLPGYQVGPLQMDWFIPPIWMPTSPFGEHIRSSEGITDDDGYAQISLAGNELALEDEIEGTTQKITLEVNFTDESGLRVTHRDSLLRHPEFFYIGVKPESYYGRANTPLDFSILTVDWDKDPIQDIPVEAIFEAVELTFEETQNPMQPYRYAAKTSVIDSANPVTDAEGSVRVSFTPPAAGNYQLTLKSGNAVTEVLLWVTGEEGALWPKQPQNQINLTADAEIYQPGQDAQIFIPNPFPEGAKALVTVERGLVMDTQVLDISGSGYSLPITITEESVPNVFVSVILLGNDEAGRPDYKLGIKKILVDPLIKTLNVSLTLDPIETEPGETVSASLLITDHEGNPVQGEFSIAVVDKALLDLVEPNSLPIEDVFYGEQPLSVQTSLSLKTYASQLNLTTLDLGLGGGGMDEMLASALREDFPDTAFWQANIVTGADGTAKITFPLPDSLTTWVVNVRGLTEDYLVGQTESEIFTRKELMIRPVTPRFLVDGDVVEMAVVVHNNTDRLLDVDVSIQGAGFSLQNGSQQTQSIPIEAGGQTRVSWMGSVESVDTVNLIFQAVSGALFDATTPIWGDLAVKRYAMPYTFSTAGALSDEGERLEVVSLPISSDPNSGKLSLELAPSLTTTLLDGLQALEKVPYRDTLSILSALLANLNAHQALSKLGIDSPTLESDLAEMVDEGTRTLLDAQNFDGGWSWWPGEAFEDAQSDVFTTTFVMLGLTQVSQAGLDVPQQVLERGMAYLFHYLQEPSELDAPWKLDQLAFQVYALRYSEMSLEPYLDGLFTRRAELSPWSLGLLGLSIDQIEGRNNRVSTILRDLEALAVRTATGVHWDSAGNIWSLPGSPNFNTAIGLYTLAQLDPASTSLPLALRYLLVHRTPAGLWSSTFESAWALMAITEALQGTGDYQAEFEFQASLNERVIAEGVAEGTPFLKAVKTSMGIDMLYPNSPNALLIERGAGTGSLYYRVDLQTYQPASSADAVNQGIQLERNFYLAGQGCPGGEGCLPIDSIQLDPDNLTQMVTVELTVNLSNDIYHFMLEDFIPSGTEILDPDLLTSQSPTEEPPPLYDPQTPFTDGWGWWYFNDPQIYDDHVLWMANFLPSGTYTLTYQLIPTQRGSFQVLPAHAWQYFYPEVQGTSAGDVFTIE